MTFEITKKQLESAAPAVRTGPRGYALRAIRVFRDKSDRVVAEATNGKILLRTYDSNSLPGDLESDVLIPAAGLKNLPAVSKKHEHIPLTVYRSNNELEFVSTDSRSSIQQEEGYFPGTSDVWEEYPEGFRYRLSTDNLVRLVRALKKSGATKVDLTFPYKNGEPNPYAGVWVEANNPAGVSVKGVLMPQR